ncbi:MAG: hypothetical protein LAN70_12485 [Acidobacteriia bacterium]|nr:hypothetical protein [Terriglobia bacterium]
MKRAWYIAAVVVLVLVLPAMGQIRGAPASVTSMAPGRSYNPGPPASVTSLGPNGYSTPCSGCTQNRFTSGFYFPGAYNGGPANLRPKRHRNNNAGAYYPIYVPYAYPVAVAAEPEPEAEAEPDPPAPTIFEHRATSERVHDSSHYANPPTVADDQSPADAREQIPVVLVYLDGHEQEVKNYAIVGPTLYDLGAFVAHKIPLAELNLKATIKANDDRGVEFSVPSWVKME